MLQPVDFILPQGKDQEKLNWHSEVVEILREQCRSPYTQRNVPSGKEQAQAGIQRDRMGLGVLTIKYCPQKT